ncbi:hypothetical protein Mpop_2526 [Methylorubrum populi BJ001]|jgi:hypothetical protein|uniref:Uncharacterized protein n=4 Tax=Methylobacteriaceae TaxID=119045 RepID=A0A509EFB6_9HYPH|nr:MULTISPECIES: hypothetical protein [Methylobacteriaceae]MDV2985999.1 hypothetical protein [Methylobacteriaceae bacterium AG10]ACB80685.1 hypothetical protein Mpop_2526 [Methylorubrum populi BJ001]MBB5761953.1 hypothetical protein [Methylorubrum rhodesianum]UMY19447.1 hypothetical protein MMB17_09185 [Methylobacterium organophilum]VUD72165.1 hypothetical protein MET9862_02759 [Methylobacterium symbioticum]
MDDLDFGGLTGADDDPVTAAFLDPDFDRWDGDVARALGRRAADFDGRGPSDADDADR